MGNISFKRQALDRDLYQTGHDLLDPQSSEVLSASWDRAWKFSPTKSIGRMNELRGLDDPQLSQSIRRIFADTDMSKFDPDSPIGAQMHKLREQVMDNELLEPNYANEKYGLDGALKFDGPVPKQAAIIMRDRKLEEIRMNDVINRASGFDSVLSFGTELGTAMLDPLNIASAFIPIYGEARFARLAAKVGTRRARLVAGGVDGAFGNALVEPVILSAAQQEQADYTMADTLTNIIVGGIAGSGLHFVGGEGVDFLKGVRARSHQKALHKGVADLAQGNEIEVGHVIADDPMVRVAATIDDETGMDLVGPMPQPDIEKPLVQNNPGVDMYGQAVMDETNFINLEKLTPVVDEQTIQQLKKSPLYTEGRLDITNEPLHPSDLKEIGDQMGSNPGALYEGTDGVQWYVKTPETTAHVNNEYLAGLLYEAAGVKVPELRPVADEGLAQGTTKARIASKMIAGLQDITPAKIAEMNDPDFLDSFVVDAWLANWDVVSSNNAKLGPDGSIIRLDFGGALQFRAQGKPKGDMFGGDVVELSTMRDSTKNADGSTAFANVSEKNIENGVKKVLSISERDLREMIQLAGFEGKEAQSIFSALRGRQEYLAKQYPEIAQTAHYVSKSGATTSFTWLKSFDTMKKFWGKVKGKLSVAEKKFLKSYQGSSSELNEYLRTKQHQIPAENYTVKGSYAADHIKNLDSALNKSKLDSPMVLWRSITSQAMMIKGRLAEVNSGNAHKLVGQVLKDRGYMSTALSPGSSVVNSGTLVLRLDVPAGYKAILVDAGKSTKNMDYHESMSSFTKSEQELILDRDTRMVVVGTYTHKKASGAVQTVLDVKVIPKNLDRMSFLRGVFYKSGEPWQEKVKVSHAADPSPLPEVGDLDAAALVRGTDSHGHAKTDTSGPKTPGENKPIGTYESIKDGESSEDLRTPFTSEILNEIDTLSKEIEEMKAGLDAAENQDQFNDIFDDYLETLQNHNDAIKEARIQGVLSKKAAKCLLGVN